MNETELKELIDKIENGEKIDISLFTDEQKEAIKQAIDSITKAVEEIVSFLVDKLIPTIKEAVEIVSSTFRDLDKDFRWQYYKIAATQKQEIEPLYLDKRSKIHRCRNNC